MCRLVDGSRRVAGEEYENVNDTRQREKNQVEVRGSRSGRSSWSFELFGRRRLSFVVVVPLKGGAKHFLWIKNRPWLLIVLMGRGRDLSRLGRSQGGDGSTSVDPGWL